jgi:hypothetical protein
MNATTEQTLKWTLDLGKVDANGRGRKVNRVTLDIELRHKTNNVAPYLDIDLNECREYAELSICGNVWNAAGTDISSGGQCTDTISALFPENAAVQRLVDIWGRYHLGGMKPGTRAQEKFLADARVKAVYPQSQYELDCKVLEKANLLTVVGGPLIQNAHGQTVQRNYQYGSAWLVERLPADVEAEVVRICGELAGAAAVQGEQSKDFAEEHDITATSTSVDSNPNLVGASNRDADHYKVTLRRGKARLTVYYTKGSAHRGQRPTAIEVLGCLASDSQSASESFEDWCANSGEDTDSRTAEKTYKTCKAQAQKLRRFLGDGLFRALLEDSNG